MEPLKITIKVNKLDKSAFFRGKNGDIYASFVVWPSNDGEDAFGNTCTLKQDLGKDRREEKTQIIGNGKPLRKRLAPAPQPQQRPPGTKTLYEEMQDNNEIPF